ncbi:MAG: hypothetical protein ACREMH_10925 [Gemmatimonadales bacterium]
MSDKPGGALAPIKPERLVREVREICGDHRSGTSSDLVYEQRFARMIGEVRDRRLDGDRATVMAALTPLRDEGVVTPQEWDRLLKSLGLA